MLVPTGCVLYFGSGLGGSLLESCARGPRAQLPRIRLAAAAGRNAAGAKALACARHAHRSTKFLMTRVMLKAQAGRGMQAGPSATEGSSR
jgi:hypothetical protein